MEEQSKKQGLMGIEETAHVMELPEDQLGGVAGAKRFHILFAGKTASERFPYIVFNEKVSGEIGRMIGLNCPEVLIENFDDKKYFFSHWQETTTEGTTLPPGATSDILQYFRDNPKIVHGMIIFDLFIANNDRKRDNIILRSDGNLALIDHGNALLYYKRGEGRASSGIERLDEVEKDLKTVFDKPHAFLRLLNDEEMVDFWTDRISQIPDYFIESLIMNLPVLDNINVEIKEKTIAFLVKRKSYLKEHIFKCRDMFPGLAEE